MQENLKRGLAIVSAAIAAKNTLPVLANVLLVAEGNRLKLAGTNLEVGVTHWIGAQVQEEGAATIPAKLLADVVGSLPNDRVTLTLDSRTQSVRIECGRFTTNIKGIEADEYPTIPSPTMDKSPALPGKLLTSFIDQVALAAASDDSRPVLAGVLVRLKGSELMMAAADGFRLAHRTATLPNPLGKNGGGECIVPAKSMSIAGKIFSGVEGEIQVAILPSQIAFQTEDTLVVSRLIDGKFPDVERIIPRACATRAVLEVIELRKATKLAAFFATSNQNVVKLTLQPGGDIAPGSLTLSANAVEVGDNTGSIDATITGETAQIALNVKYIEEGLEAIGTPQVAVEVNSPSSPGVFKPVGEDGYTYIIMPMSIR